MRFSTYINEIFLIATEMLQEIGCAKIFVMELSRQINRRPPFSSASKRPAFKSESISLRVIFSIRNILTRAMSSLELYLFASMHLYWILGELRKISIKHKSAGPCHPIMAEIGCPGGAE